MPPSNKYTIASKNPSISIAPSGSEIIRFTPQGSILTPTVRNLNPTLGEVYLDSTDNNIYAWNGICWIKQNGIDGSFVLVNKTNHGFTTGQAVYYDGYDGYDGYSDWKLAKSDSYLTLGQAVVEYIDDDNFKAIFSGIIRGLSGLGFTSLGDYYFVSDSIPGQLTNSEPTLISSYSNPLLLLLTEDSGIILNFRPSSLEPGGAGSGGESLFTIVNAPGHSFKTGDAVYYDGSVWNLAKSDSYLTLGNAVVEYIDSSNFKVIFSGIVSGLTGFSNPGEYYFVSDTTPGLLVLNQPTLFTSFSNPLLFLLTNDKGIVFNFRPSAIAPGPPVGGNFNYITISETNNFPDGYAVYFDGYNWLPADASNSQKLSFGIAKNSTGSTFDFYFSGLVNISGGNFNAGDYYFVSDTNPGELTSAEPSALGSYSNPLFFALNQTNGIVLPFRPSSASTNAQEQSIDFTIDGDLSTIPMLPSVFNAPKFFNTDRKITSVSLIRRIAGMSGTTRVDILINGTSIFANDSEKPQVQSSDGNYAMNTSYVDVIVPFGNYVEAQLEIIEGGNPSDIRVSVNYI